MDSRLDRAAAKLIETRRNHRLIDSLDHDEQPRTLDEGYAIERHAAAAWPDRLAGWKVGATSREIQALFGIGEPICGPVFARTLFDSPATVDTREYPHRLIESELTFRIGRRVVPGGSPYSRVEVLAFVDALIPSFELVSPRFTSLTVKNIPQLVADFCANGGAVFGPACRDWQSLDLCALPVTLFIDGQERQSGTGSLALGDPVNALTWLVNKVTSRGQTIEAGQFVMTGTVTGLHAPPIGSTATARFGALGDVSVSFA